MQNLTNAKAPLMHSFDRPGCEKRLRSHLEKSFRETADPALGQFLKEFDEHAEGFVYITPAEPLYWQQLKRKRVKTMMQGYAKGKGDINPMRPAIERVKDLSPAIAP